MIASTPAPGVARPDGRESPVVVADSISKDYLAAGGAVHALRGVSLTVDAGRMISIVGPSGCGKSTLLHLLGGIDLPTGGTVTLLGRPTHTLRDAELARLRLANVGFIFQRFFLLPMLTAEENVMLPMLEAGVAASERRRRASALLDSMGLSGRAGHRPGQLSGGEMQRVAIGRALANHPALLLADEPTGELDDATGRDIMRLLRGATEDGRAVVVVTHNAELAALADVQLRMLNGTIV